MCKGSGQNDLSNVLKGVQAATYTSSPHLMHYLRKLLNAQIWPLNVSDVCVRVTYTVLYIPFYTYIHAFIHTYIHMCQHADSVLYHVWGTLEAGPDRLKRYALVLLQVILQVCIYVCMCIRQAQAICACTATCYFTGACTYVCMSVSICVCMYVY